MTCQHVHTQEVHVIDHKLRTCLTCGHGWREWPIAMTDAEYDSSLLILAAWHLLNPGPPDGRTQP